MKGNRILVAISLLLVAFTVCLASRVAKLRQENSRLSGNLEALTSESVNLRDKLGNEVSRSQALELSKREFEVLCSQQASTISQLQLKVQRLESVASIVTVLTDTVYIRAEPSIISDSLTVVPFKYNDNWLDISGRTTLYKSDTTARVDLSYYIRDSLDVIIYREPKRFLFIRYGTKRYDCYVRSLNPKSHVVLNKCTILKRRRSKS